MKLVFYSPIANDLKVFKDYEVLHRMFDKGNGLFIHETIEWYYGQRRTRYYLIGDL